MEWILLSTTVILIFILFLFFLKKVKKNKPSNLDKYQKTQSGIVEVKEEPKQKLAGNREELVLKEEHEFIIEGTKEAASKTSRNRQMLLMDMSSYDGVTLEINPFKTRILILNDAGYDLGYLNKEDLTLIQPYINQSKYKIESGVQRFFRDENGENLVIYVTILEWKIV